jgi:hypothetical protein
VFFIFIAAVFSKIKNYTGQDSVITQQLNIKYNFIAVNPVDVGRMKFRKFVFLLIILFTVPFMQGCRSLFVNSPEKKAAKKQERADKEFDKNYSKIKSAHYKNQTRETKKRMRKNRRKAARMNRTKKTKSKWDCK